LVACISANGQRRNLKHAVCLIPLVNYRNLLSELAWSLPEILLDDSRRYADLVGDQGGWCEVHVWEGMVHVFQSNFELLRAGEESLTAISEFLERHLRGSAISREKVST
jgi:hypothetical protein